MARSSVRLCLCLLQLMLVVAAAANNIANTAPTRTNCPLYDPTPAVPSPTNSVCGVPGVLSRPKPLRAYCGESLRGIGDVDYIIDEQTRCYRACARDAACVSYSLDLPHYTCYTYSASLAEMGFQRNANRYEFFYNIRDCYNCTLPPPPARSACPSEPRPKSGKSGKPSRPGDLGCGEQHIVRDYSSAVFVEGVYTFKECYDYCTQDFDPVGQCQAFVTYYWYYFNTTTCFIFNNTLKHEPYEGTKNGSWSGWNLRDCFECNEPYPPVPSCIPTTQPYNIGVRNGGFQDTYFDVSNSKKLQAREWTPYQNASVVYTRGGNKVAALGADQGPAGQYDLGSLSQSIYGLVTNASAPNRFYSFQFDLAIPVSYHENQTSCKLLFPGISDAQGVYISADNATYRGSTLKTYGPYVVDASVLGFPDSYRAEFQAVCLYGDVVQREGATFWIDNFRITQNGRDVGT